MANNFFCLDLSESFIKVVDAQKSGNLLEIAGLGFVPSIPNFYATDTEKNIQEQAKVIDKLISDLKIRKKNVNVIIPDSLSYSQAVEMPPLNEKELLAAIKYQADQFIPMPLEETNLDIAVLNEDKINRKISVLIVATSKKVIEKVEKVLNASGLIPQSLENELSANLSFFSEIFANHAKNKFSVVVNASLTSTTLYLINEQTGSIIQTHNFNTGYELFFKELKQNLNLEDVKIEETLKNIGFKNDASYNISEFLAPPLTSFLKQIEKFIAATQEKFNLKVERVLLINEAVRINDLAVKTETYFKIPSINIDLYPIIKPNNSIENIRVSLPLFISAFGGNL